MRSRGPSRNPVARRADYAVRYGVKAREAERLRREREPVLVRAQRLRDGMRERARDSGLPFDSDVFTVAMLVEWLALQPECECCGQPFDFSPNPSGRARDRAPSLDRVRPSMGYVFGNVALLCWRCNNLKRDAGPEELALVARWTAAAYSGEETTA